VSESQPGELGFAQLQRICRDLAWSELASFASLRPAIGTRLCAQPVRWDADHLNVDSLHRVHLATAAATWCDAFDSGFSDLFLAKRHSDDWGQVMLRSRQAKGSSPSVTFSTSGSTGQRKHIRHREAFLRQEAADWAVLLPQVKRVVTLVATHHIYGFIWGVLLPQALGVAVVDGELACLPEPQAGDLWVAVPDQWQWLAQSKKTWPAGVVGISSTAPMPADTHQALLHNGLARLVQVYGSTETSGLAWRDQPDQAYALATGRQRQPDDSIALQLSPGQWVQAPVQDQLNWVDAQRFNLLGRTDQSVQIGGHNVSPQWVADQLMLHPAVQQASVRLDSQLDPARLKAFVVLAPAVTDTQQVLQHAQQTLPWYAAPASITFGDELPCNAMGKLSDWQTTSG
jgi:long-chain acyl-CoA synthetase